MRVNETVIDQPGMMKSWFRLTMKAR